MDEPGWITFYTAADTIRKRFDCGWAEAKERLRVICRGALIDTKKAPLHPERVPYEFWVDVAPSEWRVYVRNYGASLGSMLAVFLMASGHPICRSNKLPSSI